MKRHDTNIEAHLGLFRSPPTHEMAAAERRALDRLRPEVTDSMAGFIEESRSIKFHWRWRLALIGATAVVAVALVMEAPDVRSLIIGITPAAVVETADGLYRISGQVVHAREKLGVGEVVRTNGGAGALLALADGSRIEMRAQSALVLERADDGMRIRLGTGGIIVTAAKQPRRHLYVQTKDMTVSVVGTIFLVNAETDGSRVAVIEGEVRVHEGTTETKLHPGQQVSTSRTLAVLPVKEEIAWSRMADAHLAILAAFTKGIADTSGSLTPVATPFNAAQATGGQTPTESAKPAFEAASIRRCDPDELPTAPAGARGGGANSVQMTPGRTHALCLTLATLIRQAYGYGAAGSEFLNPGGRGRGPRLEMNNVYGLGAEDGLRVRGGPDWVRADHYTIEAVADGAATAATMSGPMLRDLLERRFQLNTHIETEQVPAFSLSIAMSGLKIKPVESDAVSRSGFVNVTKNGGACELPPPTTPGQPMIVPRRSFVDVRRGEKPNCGISVERNGANQVIVGGGTTFETLSRALGAPLGGIPVFDKTGNTEQFNLILEFVRDENTPGLTPDQRQPANVPRGQTIFTALEDQVGLKLEPVRVLREFIVIDRVERPSPNPVEDASAQRQRDAATSQD